MEIISIAISISLVISVLSITHIFSKKIDNINKGVAVNFDFLYYIAHQYDKIIILRLLEVKSNFIKSEMYKEVEKIDEEIKKFQQRIDDYEQYERNNNKR